jgi:hypothetical protein
MSGFRSKKFGTIKQIKTLHVKKASIAFLKSKGFIIQYSSYMPDSTMVYIKCNSKGVIKDEAKVYYTDELIERNNVKIVKWI